MFEARTVMLWNRIRRLRRRRKRELGLSSRRDLDGRVDGRVATYTASSRLGVGRFRFDLFHRNAH